eukprot:4687259-Pleurochrysis_carterae.AAC.1
MALQKLAAQRKKFFALNRPARARTVFNALTFQTTTGSLDQPPTNAVQSAVASSQQWRTPVPPVLYRVGNAADCLRLGCREIFLEHYPVSLATLRRIVALKYTGGDMDYESASKAAVRSGALSSSKLLEAIAWWKSHAEQMSEKLPDVDLMLTPHRFLRDIYEEYANDMKAAGAADHIESPTRFSHIFRVSPELCHIAIASGKENFGRCTVCGDLECALRAARKTGNAQQLADV